MKVRLLLLSLILGCQLNAWGQTCSQKIEACKRGCDISNPKLNVKCKIDCAKTACEAPPDTPPPVTLKPKFLVLGLVYAPPGCTGNAGTGCSSSLVDYASGSALGSKVAVKNSFKAGVKISADFSIPTGSTGELSVGGDAGFASTRTDSDSFSITKSANRDIKAFGNGDDIDHGQDMFLLLLNPAVNLRQQDLNIFWNPGYSGPSTIISEVYVSELRKPSTMRPALAIQFKNLGFTTQDFQTILCLDPFGGKVATGGHLGDVTAIGACGPAAATTGEGTPTDPRLALASTRLVPTAWSLPYQPPLRLPNCNNGVCTCSPITVTLKNDFLGDSSTEVVGEYTLGFHENVGVPKVWSLKTDLNFTWTDSSTNSNSTSSTQTAAATIACPSVNYTSLNTQAQVYWDKLFGSFLFLLYDPSTVPLLHQGKVVDTAGNPLPGKLVELTVDGKTYHTVTASSGMYRFAEPVGHHAQSQTGRIAVGNVQQTVALRASNLTVVRMQ